MESCDAGEEGLCALLGVCPTSCYMALMGVVSTCAFCAVVRLFAGQPAVLRCVHHPSLVPHPICRISNSQCWPLVVPALMCVYPVRPTCAYVHPLNLSQLTSHCWPAISSLVMVCV